MTADLDATVLLIDDSTTLRSLLKGALSALALNLRVREAEDGDEGIAAFRRQPADIVFLDVNMPGRNGIEVLKEIKRIDPRSFVIMLSSDAASDWLDQARRAGVHGYVEKPFSAEKIGRVFETYRRYAAGRKTAPATC